MAPAMLSKRNYKPLRLLPFTLAESWDLINAFRQRNGLDPIGDSAKKQWNSCVALAGGHPSLLIDSFATTILSSNLPALHAASVGAVVLGLTNNHRVKEPPRYVEASMARDFALDALRASDVEDDKHGAILTAGLAWYFPIDESFGNVSAPFPYLLKLMKRAGGMLEEVADEIDPTNNDYDATKAMEYVAALAVLVKLVGNTEAWVGKGVSVPRGKAIKRILEETTEFLSVWPAKNEKATGFGGKLMVGDTLNAIIGQVKMQDFGKVSTQGRSEVMALAWFIGCAVRDENLTLPVHAFFVSSRKA